MISRLLWRVRFNAKTKGPSPMDSHLKHQNLAGAPWRTHRFMLLVLTVFAIAACSQAPIASTATPAAAAEAEEYGEYLARPEELAPVPVNDIVKSLRLNGIAMKLGKTVFDRNCAACHGEDLKGSREQHTPDLTDAEWRFAGDDLRSGGLVKYPSDVEWTVRYGIRSGNPNQRGAEDDMLAFDPQYRNERDTKTFGKARTLSNEDIEDVADYVLQLGGQQADPARAARGAVLFQDNAKGNCFDCHGDDGTGIPAFGSTDLTRKDLYLFGSDRASIVESITKGRFGVMPAYDGRRLKPEELKAVSVYVFMRAKNDTPDLQAAR
jgi:cbb3-type cytochrome c oxidase subunit III